MGFYVTQHLLPRVSSIEQEIKTIKSELEELKIQRRKLLDLNRKVDNEFNSLFKHISCETQKSLEVNNVKEQKDSRFNNEVQMPVKDVFIDNLYSIKEKGYFSDVSIMCGSENLGAHKIVLSARSPVFEAMFTSTMQESQIGTVVIDDIDHFTMTTLLTFMYSGVVEDLSVSLATNLLYAAVKYQIEGLKEICVQYLMSNVSNQNAFEILEAADLYDEELKAIVKMFIHKNFSSLKSSQEWKEMQTNHPSLAMEVYSYVVDRDQEKIEELKSIIGY